MSPVFDSPPCACAATNQTSPVMVRCRQAAVAAAAAARASSASEDDRHREVLCLIQRYRRPKGWLGPHRQKWLPRRFQQAQAQATSADFVEATARVGATVPAAAAAGRRVVVRCGQAALTRCCRMRVARGRPLWPHMHASSACHEWRERWRWRHPRVEARELGPWSDRECTGYWCYGVWWRAGAV